MHSFFHFLFIHSFIYSFLHFFIYSFIHSFIFSFTHLFIHSLNIIINGKWCKRNVKQNDWIYGFIVNNWTHIIAVYVARRTQTSWVSSQRETSPRGLQGCDTEDPTNWVSSRRDTIPRGPQGIYGNIYGNMRRQPCAGLMLSHGLRRRANINPAQGWRPLFPGYLISNPSVSI